MLGGYIILYLCAVCCYSCLVAAVVRNLSGRGKNYLKTDKGGHAGSQRHTMLVRYIIYTAMGVHVVIVYNDNNNNITILHIIICER